MYFWGEDKLASKDAAVQGTNAEWIIDDVEYGICIYEPLPPWNFWIDKTTHDRIDTLFYRFTMTSEEVLERFGEEKTPESIKRDIKASREISCSTS